MSLHCPKASCCSLQLLGARCTLQAQVFGTRCQFEVQALELVIHMGAWQLISFFIPCSCDFLHGTPFPSRQPLPNIKQRQPPSSSSQKLSIKVTHHPIAHWQLHVCRIFNFAHGQLGACNFGCTRNARQPGRAVAGPAAPG